MIDEAKREKLLRKIETLGSAGSEVAVTLEDFFDGNDDMYSIGANLGDEHPSPAAFYDTLLGIRARDDVQDVLVRIYDVDEGRWPFSDTVYIISCAMRQDIEVWMKELLPDEIQEGWMYGPPSGGPVVEPGYTPYSVWWD